ncbi:exodeoxyribonuclease VII small subunit [candidate division WOR-3 bacterium]|nr:exodeoxyribonuclease VII small subunit [candidate division WOR-3 bacterium]MCK4527254.1 exodeoxyribonuclease VII small subunit [candidate division WOR-3 bacterium]
MEFEKKLQRLEEIVEKMEKGELPLDKTLKFFEEGMKLLDELKKYLSKAEIRIQGLIKEGGEKLKTDEYRELSGELEEQD